jgi:hypothetical protein
MRGTPALTYVKAHPLEISASEAQTLSDAVRDLELGKLAKKFDGASQVGPFHELPRDTQTAIASLYYQYGTDAPDRAAPHYWRQITTGDWNGAYRNLLDFGDDYGPRRIEESKRLLKDIQSGRLPRPKR